jgi:amino acid adenylation domain-containing protein
MLFNSLAKPGAEVQQVVIRPPRGVSTSPLRAGFERAIERHRSLRTTIALEGGDARCVQHEHAGLSWVESEHDRTLDELLPSLIANDRQRGVDVSALPVFRLQRLVASDGEALLWTFHHAHLDGRSIELVLTDVLGVALGASTSSYPSPDPRAHVAAALDEARRADAIAYYRRELDGLDDIATLATFDVRSSDVPSRQLEHPFRVEPELMQQLEAHAETFDFTWATAVVAAWATVLSRYSYTTDVVFGVTRACRHVTPTSVDTVGCLINTVPMRVSLDPSERIVSFLSRVRRTSLEQRPFETLGLREVADAVGIDDASQLVRSVVVCEGHTLQDKLRADVPLAADWSFRLMGRSGGPLTIAAYRTPDRGMDLVVEHDEAALPAWLARQLGVDLTHALRAFANQPFAVVGEVACASTPARIEGTPPDAPTSISGLFQGVFEEHATRVALVDVDSGEELTFAALRESAESLAGRLTEVGVRVGDVVAVLAKRRPETVIAWLATQLGGFVYLPIDPAYPEERTRFVLKDAGAVVIVCSDDDEGETPNGLRRVSFDGPSVGRYQRPHVDPESLAYIIYTSGSTGAPKGVCVSQRALAAHARAAVATYALTPRDHVLQFASPSFDVYLEEVVPTLLAGARVVIRSEKSGHALDELLRLLERESISVLQLPTAYFNELAIDLTRQPSWWPSRVRAVIVGGERLNAEACRRFRLADPSVRLVNAYGPTEVTITSTFHDVGQHVPSTIPIGGPFGACHAYVVDRWQRVAPLGARGELVLGGPQVASRYHERPEETQRRFIVDPVESKRGRAYRTGDLVSTDIDGVITFEGRVDAQVKVRGFRIELGEVEAALERDPAISEATARVLNSPSGEAVLVAFVVAPSSERESAILQRLSARVPVALIPSRVFVVEAIPRTAGGKIDRRALVWPANQDESPPSDQPMTEMEREVLALFREVLGDGHTSVEDGFFDRGGTSIRALRLISRVQEHLGARPTVATLIANPSPRLLARWIASHEEGAPPGERVLLNGIESNATPVYCVVGLHVYAPFAKALHRRPVYGIFVPEETDFPGQQVGVESLADVYLRALGSYGETPRLLCGVSFGALVAFEMAQRLAAAGSPPDLLILLDPRLPSMWRDDSHESWRNLVARLRNDPLSVPGRVVDRARRLLSRDPPKPSEGDPEDQARWLAREQAYARALRDYEPRIRRYPGRAHVYVARDEAPAQLPAVARRWKALVGADSQIEIVPGTHGVMLTEPYVREISTRLDLELRTRRSVSFRAVRG